MTPALATRPYLRPADVARDLGVNQSKVLGWIRSGELRGVNVATRLGGRPRWRIAQVDLDSFLMRRSAAPAPKVTKLRKRKDDAVIEFF